MALRQERNSIAGMPRNLPLIALVWMCGCGIAGSLPGDDGGSTGGTGGIPGKCRLQTEWRPTSGFAALPDAEAAGTLCTTAEQRPLNATANGYVPSAAELHAFLSAKDNNGATSSAANPYSAFVTGGCGASGRSTDDIIQCTAAKWGIPVDWLRAEYIVESGWAQIDAKTHQPETGDLENVGLTAALQYPDFSRQLSGGQPTGYVYQSLGLTQVRWTSTGTVGAGTEPLRWKSTAFNADFQGATVRFYYDNPQHLRAQWGDASYVAGDPWLSIGGWFNPYPWNNSAQQGYISAVKAKLEAKPWLQSGF